jgi:adenine-specific DNA-methyltransferase
VIKYLGSKRLLVPLIVEQLHALPEVSTVVDLFSGTSRVGHALKRAGLRVRANDHNRYAATLARCYVAADAERVRADAERLVAELDALPGDEGWFTARYAREARYFRPENAARIEAIRAAIAARGLEPELEAVLLTALMEAADRVDSTTGVQMAYLKQWAPRAQKRLTLRVPEVLPRAAAGPGEAHELDALAAVEVLDGDAIYVDPPYNQHKYVGNYHVWETLVRWDQPEVYGTANKRVDCRARKSPFNSRRQIAGALAELVARARCRWLLVSFSNEGFVTRAALEAILRSRGPVEVTTFDQRRYVGAQIGVYNPRGERVGEPKHLRNEEYLFLVDCR